MKKYSEKHKKLQNEIALLKLRKTQQESDIRHEFYETTDLLNPSNIISSTVVQLYNEPIVRNSIVKNSIRFVTGYLSRRFFVGKSNSIIKSMLGYASQIIVSNAIVKEVNT